MLYKCLKCGEIGTKQEISRHWLKHSPDWMSFFLGFGAATIVFTTVGRKFMMSLMGLGKREVEELTTKIEARAKRE